MHNYLKRNDVRLTFVAYKRKKNMPNTFVLNDETVVNDRGFRTVNSGINLERFKANPVILDYHRSGNNAVIGRWENIRIEGSELKADAVFDEEDEDAKKIAGKVERGFLKGASMGLGFDRSEEPFVFEDATGKFALTKSELLEASIVSIPSNRKSIKLYNKEHKELQEDEVQLALEDASNEELNKNDNMSNVKLTVAVLATLGLENTDNQQELQDAITRVANENVSLKKENKELKEAQEKEAKARATELVDLAITEGKIMPDTKDSWVNLAQANPKHVEATLKGIPAKVSLNGLVTGGKAVEVKTADDFEKLSDEAKLAFKENHPEEYKNLFA